jgi:hypothetical protein
MDDLAPFGVPTRRTISDLEYAGVCSVTVDDTKKMQTSRLPTIQEEVEGGEHVTTLDPVMTFRRQLAPSLYDAYPSTPRSIEVHATALLDLSGVDHTPPPTKASMATTSIPTQVAQAKVIVAASQAIDMLKITK